MTRQARRCLAEAWASLSGRPADFAPEEQAARREIVARSFSAQLEACAAAFAARRDCLGRPCAACSPSCWRTSRSIAPTAPTASSRRADRAVLQQAADGARKTCLATDRWAVDPVLRLFGAPAGKAGRRALPAIERAGRRQGRRGHGLLSLRPAALAQRCRLRRRNLSPRRRRLPCPRAGARPPAIRMRCWRRPRTITSAARTCAPASRC